MDRLNGQVQTASQIGRSEERQGDASKNRRENGHVANQTIEPAGSRLLEIVEIVAVARIQQAKPR